MKKTVISIFIIVATLGFIMLGCAPKPTSNPATSSVPVKASGTSADDENWNKVIEAAKREGVVKAYSFHLTGDRGAALISAFEKRYGVKVEVTSGPGTQMIERMKTEHTANQQSADIFTTDFSIIILAKNQALTQGVGDIPSLRGTQDKWRRNPIGDPPDGHILPLSHLVYTAYVNTNLVPPGNEPRSFKELLDPKWKGKIIEADPASDPAPNQAYFIYTSRKILTPDYYNSLAKQNLIIAPQYMEKLQMLARGAGSIALSVADESASSLIAKGAPMKAIKLGEGAMSPLSSSITMVAKAPHPNAARLFINWWLSPEGQETWGKASSTTPILASVTSFLEPNARIDGSTIILGTLQDAQGASKLMVDRTLAKMFLGQ